MRYMLLMVFVAPLVGCSKPAAVEPEPLIRPVRVAMVTEGGAMRERAFSGVSQSTLASRISFRVSGTVIELPVQAGERLSEGALIARLNTSTYDLAVQQAEASLAQARANQRNADANYTRAKELYENSNASRNDLDSARASAESAQAQVASARKSLEIAELERSYTRLTAAQDCTIASLDMELNENVSAGTPVAQVNCGEGVEVRISVPESLISGLEQGQGAVVRFSALSNQTFEGRISEIGVAGASSAATFPVVVILSEPSDEIRPSMAAEVSFEFRNGDSGVVVIPASAVVNDERGSHVFLAEPTGAGRARIARRAVKLGELRGGGIEVQEGLSDGDRVVTAGVSVIRDSQIVQLPEG